MRTPSRQQRRAHLCFGAPKPHRHRIAISPRRLALTAEEADLVEVAARIAAELELTPELVELLLPAPAAALTPH